MDVYNSYNYSYGNITIPLAIILIVKFLDINILVFANVLIVLGLFIDFLIYLNSSPVPLPYEREHFIRCAIKATIRWIGWVFVFWILSATLCAMGTYIGIPYFEIIANGAGLAMLTSVVLYDIRKLRYTQFYYFEPVKQFINVLCNILGCDYSDEQTSGNSTKGDSVKGNCKTMPK